MGRGPKPARGKAKPAVSRKSPKNEGSKVHDLEKRLAEALQREAEALRQLQTSHHERAEAQEQQAATAEILRVISSSPTDLQPVMDIVAKNAARVCGASDAVIFRVEDDMLRPVAVYGPLPALHTLPLNRESVTGRSVIDRHAIHIHDLAAVAEVEFPLGRAIQRLRGHRTTLATPLLREGTAIGAILIRRVEVRPFSDGQVALLETFADQAVIAIENVRLFKELEARNHALTESLDQQTATSEILRVISSSPADTRPVFDAIAESAARLCSANDAQVLRVEGDILRLVAACGATSMPSVRQLTRGHLVGRAVIDRQTIHVRDLAQALAEYPETTATRYGIQSALAVPLMHEGVALGVIRISRTEIRPFTDKQIALLKTFADQAVIAIENVRLFTELQTRNGELTEALDTQTATSDILRVISQSPTDVQPVFDAIVKSARRLLDGIGANVARLVGQELHLAAFTATGDDADHALRATYPMPISGWNVAARAARACSPVYLADVETDAEYRASGQNLKRARGVRSLLAVPMMSQNNIVGTIAVSRREPGSFSDKEIQLLQTFAAQAVIAIENVRLFKELAAANRELAAASQHKSEFLANMSHELRTPLNAIIGFSEVLSEKMFGELNEKQEEYSKDIHASGQHLLSLINDILDLSKIEAGRMELELSDFHLPAALDSALTLIRERAGRRSIALQINVDERLGQIQGDERKVRQVVLNLLSNAIKFTPEGRRIEVGAMLKDGFVEVSVRDTGVGIAPEDQEVVFEEFRQVGTADKKVEGTGLGLTLCRKFVELHGGRIWVKSELGQGSTFTFAIPVRGE